MSVTKDQSVEDLFRAYFSVWDTEERVRQESWGNFMMEHLYLFAHDSGRFATLADIVEVGLHEIIAVASDNPDLQKHIEDLVHQGVPVDVRGRCWRLFVDLSLMRCAQPWYQTLSQQGTKPWEMCLRAGGLDITKAFGKQHWGILQTRSLLSLRRSSSTLLRMAICQMMGYSTRSLHLRGESQVAPCCSKLKRTCRELCRGMQQCWREGSLPYAECWQRLHCTTIISGTAKE